MFVGVFKVTLYIYGVNSLKAKRRILKSVKDRFKNKFNCQLVEVEDQDLWQKAVLGSATVSVDDKFISGLFEKMEEFIDSFPEVEVITRENEIFTF